MRCETSNFRRGLKRVARVVQQYVPPELSEETIKQLRRVATENPFSYGDIKAAYDVTPNIEAIEKACRNSNASGRPGPTPADLLAMLKRHCRN